MSSRTRRAGWLALLAALALARPATAQLQSPERSATLGEGDEWSATPRSRSTNQITMREGIWTLAGSLSFVTAEAPPEELVGSDVLRFTDLVLLNAGGRYSFGDVEVFGSTSLLPKQPSAADAMFWQGARLGARWAFIDHFALAMRTAGGPMLADRGYWNANDLQLEARASVHRTITFMGKLGASANSLLDDHRDGLEPFWFGEVLVGGEVILLAEGMAAFWLGVDFNVPVWTSSDVPDMPGATLAFDPDTRANFHLGAVLSYVEDWDLYVDYAVLDRGEEGDPQSVIPVLDSGFDQQQLVIGLVKYFAPDESDDDL
jgi:hypothetical protein